MSKRVTKCAESVASRRGFFGDLAKVAGMAAVGLACSLSAKPAAAAKRPRKSRCRYRCEDGAVIYGEGPARVECLDWFESRKHGFCELIIEGW